MSLGKRSGPPRKENALRRDKDHQRERLREWRIANPERAAETRKRNNATRMDRYRANPSLYLWRTARHRAKTLGIAFDIEPEDLVIPEYCPITGDKIDVLVSNYANGASVDKVQNDKGYVRGNVRVISRKANRMKGDADLVHLERMIAYMKGEI